MGSGSERIRKLVQAKSEWSEPIEEVDRQKGFKGWHTRGYLPHRDAPGLMQFVTFRLADSFPRAAISEWEHLWRIENDREKRRRIEAYLDRGRGSCHLAKAEIATLVEETMVFFHEQRYCLQAWVVMPNHVHVMVEIWDHPLVDIVGSWKKFSARKANCLLGSSGALWEKDYWDTYIRDEAHERTSRNYIENNPVNAGLARTPQEWKWGSARFRDEHGTLRLGDGK